MDMKLMAILTTGPAGCQYGRLCTARTDNCGLYGKS